MNTNQYQYCSNDKRKTSNFLHTALYDKSNKTKQNKKHVSISKRTKKYSKLTNKQVSNEQITICSILKIVHQFILYIYL